MPFNARPSHSPPGRGGGRAEGCCLPKGTPLVNRGRKCPCDILSRGFVFENVKATGRMQSVAHPQSRSDERRR
jgi:hypothetical protein